MKKPTKRPTGLTKETGYQIGSRRTINLPPEDAWELVTSIEGINLWLGPVSDFSFEKGTTYRLTDGSRREIRVFSPGWPRPSTIQVKVIPNGNRSVIAFHQEHLPGSPEREERREHFIRVLDALEKLSG